MTERFSIKCDIDESKSLHVFPGPSGLLCLQVKAGASEYTKVFLENDHAIEAMEGLQDILGVEVDYEPVTDEQSAERIEKLTRENSMLKAAETEQRRKIEALITRVAEAACTTQAAPEQPADPPPTWAGQPMQPCDLFPLGGFVCRHAAVFLCDDGTWCSKHWSICRPESTFDMNCSCDKSVWYSTPQESIDRLYAVVNAK